jgi:hypothetical protein
MTTRRPYYLVAGLAQDNCDPTQGYIDELEYVIKDQLNAAMPAPVPLNEYFPGPVIIDYAGTNWIRSPANGIITDGSSPSVLHDVISPVGNVNSNPAPVPYPACPGVSPPVIHFTQEWRIGITIPGFGQRVQTDTLVKYENFGDHESIVSPNP